MADFCNQCAADMGFEHGDLADITSLADEAEEVYRVVLCEGCGAIQVDNKGNCVSSDCLLKHANP